MNSRNLLPGKDRLASVRTNENRREPGKNLEAAGIEPASGIARSVSGSGRCGEGPVARFQKGTHEGQTGTSSAPFGRDRATRRRRQLRRARRWLAEASALAVLIAIGIGWPADLLFAHLAWLFGGAS